MPTRDLTKWPLLLVHGDPVSREQANEILIRTNSWYLSTNDRVFERKIYDALGLAMKKDGHYEHVDYNDLRRFEQECGVLTLGYLNNSRIVSSWIGGPHGWCDWDGSIACSNYNIGKWPSVEEVHADWTAIAEAFPYLKLRAQLVPNEGQDTEPAVEWVVEKGKAHMVEPMGLLRQAAEPDYAALAESLFSSRTRERGVSIDRLIEAVEQVRKS